MKQRRSSQRGFTLIELMVVVAIIAIISVVMFGLTSTTYGASASSIAEQLNADLNMCKMRAVSTRRWHRCEITPTNVAVLQWQTTGMATPGVGTWYTVFNDKLGNAGAGVQVWDAGTAICATNGCGGAPTAQNTSLSFDIDFRPDGTSTGGTVYITQPNRAASYRVVVYKATGSSYARNSW